MFGKAIVKCLLAMAVVFYAVAAQAVIIDLVTVGNAGNAADGDHGAVDYEYRIGKYEVTAGQYTEFLNAKAATDPYNLYSDRMDESNGCMILQSGSSGSFSYSVAADRANRPVNYLSFWNAVRFANWLHNGQGTGDTETGAYTLSEGNSLTRNAGATWFLPSEDEWYKAAYYDPDKDGGAGYWDYPTISDTMSSNDLVEPTDPGNNATFKDGSGYTIGSPYYMTEGGAHENSESPYGTFDQGGNVIEWTEEVIGTTRLTRGGDFEHDGTFLQASNRSYAKDPGVTYQITGFRVAAVIPEPGTLVLLATGLIGLLCYAWRKRK